MRRNGLILIALVTLLASVSLTVATTKAVRGAIKNRVAADADSLAEALGRPLVVSLHQIPSETVCTASSHAP